MSLLIDIHFCFLLFTKDRFENDLRIWVLRYPDHTIVYNNVSNTVWMKVQKQSVSVALCAVIETSPVLFTQQDFSKNAIVIPENVRVRVLL